MNHTFGLWEVFLKAQNIFISVIFVGPLQDPKEERGNITSKSQSNIILQGIDLKGGERARQKLYILKQLIFLANKFNNINNLNIIWFLKIIK